MENTNYILCAWCGEEWPQGDCRKEIDLGYICPHCEEVIKSRGEELHFEDEDYPLEEAKKKKHKDCSSVTYTTGDPQKNADHFNKMLVGKAENNHMDGLPGAWAATESGSSAGTGDGGGCCESLELDEAAILSRKARAYIDIPDEIKLLPVEDVTNFVEKLDIDEEFTVGYATPIYFYAKMLNRFTLIKCTEMTGTTGVDYRDANVDDDKSGIGSNDATRLARAKNQYTNPTGETNYDIKDVNTENNRVKSTVWGMRKSYGLVNKTVNQEKVRIDDLTDDGVKVKNAEPKYAGENLATILFYPKTGTLPKVSYYLRFKVPVSAAAHAQNLREEEWSPWHKVDRDLLSSTIYAKLHELAEIDRRNGATLDFDELMIKNVVKKVDAVLESDAQTANDRAFDSTTNYDGHYKAEVRALYTNQIYYLANKNTSLGAKLNESLNKLTEAKRYVRRYYVRPQDVFCSNKKEIIKVLIDAYNDGQNCTVYTLNNQGDTKDTGKLTSADIIYTFDDGVLKDKNDVPVFDYDLYIKHEEKRDSIEPNQVSDAKFNDVYDDRMTDQTVIESVLTESQSQEISQYYQDLSDQYGIDLEELVYGKDGFMNYCYPNGFPDFSGDVIFSPEYWDEFEKWLKDTKGVELPHEQSTINVGLDDDDTFKQEFESYDKLTEAKEPDEYCAICGEKIEGYGNNAEPIKDGKCCDACNAKFVIPARLEQMHEQTDK